MNSTYGQFGYVRVWNLNADKISTKYSFTDEYVKGVYVSENIITYTKQLNTILNAKYKKVGLNELVEEKFQL